MIEIKDLLSRFGNILLSEEIKKEAVVETISKITKIKIKKEDVKIKDSTIYLNIKPIYKNEVLLKQEKIFLGLKELLGNKTPRDIR